jgi:hypothetical protein
MKAILKDFSSTTFLQQKVAEELTLLHTGRAFVTFEYSLTKNRGYVERISMVSSLLAIKIFFYAFVTKLIG